MSTSAYSYQYLIKIVSIKSIKTEMIDFKEAPLELIFLYFVRFIPNKIKPTFLH